MYGGGKGRERRGEEKRILGLLECAEREREGGLLCHRKRKRLDGHQLSSTLLNTRTLQHCKVRRQHRVYIRRLLSKPTK